MSDIYKIFCGYIQENNIISENDHIIIGLSGGADSMCLTALLYAFSQDLKIDLTAVHVNHQLRGTEADEDEKFVKEFCRERKIRCVAVKAAVRDYAFEHGISLEEAGRIARYQTFYQVARKISPDGTVTPDIKAAVAHHMDDNAETILLNMVRGSGTKGMQGMQPGAVRFGINIIRPMLCIGRSQIESFLKEEKIAYRTDSTNSGDEFARNKVRLNIIPELKKVNSRASYHINEAARDIVAAQKFIEEEADKAWQMMVDQRQGGYYVDLGRFGPLNDVVKGQIIRNIIEKLGGSLKDIGRVHVESILSLQEKQTGRSVQLPYGIFAERSYSNIIIRNTTNDDILARNMMEYVRSGQSGVFDEERFLEDIIQTRDDTEPDPDAFMIDPGQLSYDPVRYRLWGNMEIELQLVQVNPVTRQYLIAKNDYTKAFDCAKIKGNLVLRRPEPSDEIQFFGGKKTVKKFFVDEKVPQEERNRALVLCDDKQVMWIVGYRMSESYKISDMTNLALQISFMEADYE